MNVIQPSQSCFCLWRHDLQTESTGSLRSIVDSCSRCERVDNSKSSWVELCRYKRAFKTWVEFSWVQLYRYKRAFSFLLLECSAFSGRSRPPMTPVFSVISFFLDVYIPCRCSSTSLSLYHSVSHESLTLPFCLLRLYAERIHFSTHDLTIFLSLSDGVHEASVFIHRVQNLLIGSV